MFCFLLWTAMSGSTAVTHNVFSFQSRELFYSHMTLTTNTCLLLFEEDGAVFSPDSISMYWSEVSKPKDFIFIYQDFVKDTRNHRRDGFCTHTTPSTVTIHYEGPYIFSKNGEMCSFYWGGKNKSKVSSAGDISYFMRNSSTELLGRLHTTVVGHDTKVSAKMMCREQAARTRGGPSQPWETEQMSFLVE